MKNDDRISAEYADLRARHDELELTCRLWMAVAEAKETRIAELEEELDSLRQRVARLSRRGERVGAVRTRRQGLRRTPTAG